MHALITTLLNTHRDPLQISVLLSLCGSLMIFCPLNSKCPCLPGLFQLRDASRLCLSLPFPCPCAIVWKLSKQYAGPIVWLISFLISQGSLSFIARCLCLENHCLMYFVWVFFLAEGWSCFLWEGKFSPCYSILTASKWLRGLFLTPFDRETNRTCQWQWRRIKHDMSVIWVTNWVLWSHWLRWGRQEGVWTKNIWSVWMG